MKTSELTGPLLDYWVAKALGGNAKIQFRICYIEKVCADWMKFSPSTDWSQGGPIIEREQFALIPVIGGTWCAERNVPTGGDDYEVAESHGETLLIAGMRAYVASKFGEEVPDGNV